MTDVSPAGRAPATSPWLAYAQLLRLPNVFTAIADIVAAFLLTHPVLGQGDGVRLAMLIVTSCLLYTAGMVLNDVWDYEVDARQRPSRPLPSGRIARARAMRLGAALLAAGVLCGGVVSAFSGSVRPFGIALALALCIAAYDGFLKRTPLGPVTMGACRMLNWWLGMSLMAGSFESVHLLAAGAIGLYITGVTLLARTEATVSGRLPLSLAGAIIVTAIILLGWVPGLADPVVPLLVAEPNRWPTLLGLLGLMLLYRLVGAILEPTPARVQWAVRSCLTSLLFLDAAICFVVWGLPGAVVVLLLLLPMTVLGRWVYAT